MTITELCSKRLFLGEVKRFFFQNTSTIRVVLEEAFGAKLSRFSAFQKYPSRAYFLYSSTIFHKSVNVECKKSFFSVAAFWVSLDFFFICLCFPSFAQFSPLRFLCLLFFFLVCISLAFTFPNLPLFFLVFVYFPLLGLFCFLYLLKFAFHLALCVHLCGRIKKSTRDQKKIFLGSKKNPGFATRCFGAEEKTDMPRPKTRWINRGREKDISGSKKRAARFAVLLLSNWHHFLMSIRPWYKRSIVENLIWC